MRNLFKNSDKRQFLMSSQLHSDCNGSRILASEIRFQNDVNANNLRKIFEVKPVGV